MKPASYYEMPAVDCLEGGRYSEGLQVVEFADYEHAMMLMKATLGELEDSWSLKTMKDAVAAHEERYGELK